MKLNTSFQHPNPNKPFGSITQTVVSPAGTNMSTTTVSKIPTQTPTSSSTVFRTIIHAFVTKYLTNMLAKLSTYKLSKKQLGSFNR